MKTIMKIMGGGLLVFSLALHTSAQTTTPLTPIGEEGRLPDQLEKKDVPNIVTTNYYRDYPSSTVETWYVYPEYTYVDGTDWYVYSPSLVGGSPEYYMVEFTTDKTPHKVVYSKTGQRMSTYRGMSSSNLPKVVLNALKKSVYKDWKITDEKEEIWRESDKKKIYKVVVEQGTKKHVLYYQEDGKLLKDKNIK